MSAPEFQVIELPAEDDFVKSPDGVKPKPGQTVTMEYTGWLYDPEAEDKKGEQFDTSVGRGDFKTRIGVGQVIEGWDKGVPQMQVGEKVCLIIPGHMAYGDSGFPGLIPANATLLFEVKLKSIL